MTSETDQYVLGRDFYSSVRLDAQHLLWKLYNDYTMNPKIPIAPGMKIAEIGTGTGMWILDLASQLPQTVRLHGYDVSGGQFPHESILPANVTLSELDAFGDVPPELVETYDVVHLRFWCCVLKGNDPSRLIRHATKLLKPGGYLQWEDASLNEIVVLGKEAQAFSQIMRSVLGALGLDFNWLSDIQEHVEKEGLIVVDGDVSSFPTSLIPLATNTFLVGHFEFFQAIDKLNDPSIPTGSECRKLLLALLAETRKGARYHWLPVRLLAKKPVDV